MRTVEESSCQVSIVRLWFSSRSTASSWMPWRLSLVAQCKRYTIYIAKKHFRNMTHACIVFVVVWAGRYSAKGRLWTNMGQGWFLPQLEEGVGSQRRGYWLQYGWFTPKEIQGMFDLWWSNGIRYWTQTKDDSDVLNLFIGRSKRHWDGIYKEVWRTLFYTGGFVFLDDHFGDF